MADWNPTTLEEWARAFGLVALPYFGRHRSSPVPPGTHLMMQDGEAASFALHVATPDPFLTSEQPLAWAWSSNVRHTIVLDPATKAAIVRRWDDPARQVRRVLGSDEDARNLIHDIERSQAPVPSSDVINETLWAFNLLRDAIEQRGGTEIDVVVAFNAALLLAGEWRNLPDRLPRLKLAEIVASLHGQGRSGFDSHSDSPGVRDYPIGDFARILLEHRQGGAPYLLDADLLLRHASGLLYQEAHRRLVKAVAPVRQPSLYNDELPSEPSGRRHPPPSFVHYTPPWLARALVEFALKSGDWPRDRRLDVLDPACGSGVFLIETVRELERFRTGEVQLRGMDLSAVAGTMTKFCVGEASRDLANVSVFPSIQYGIDSLEADWGQPDIVLMNPPFKAWKDLSSIERATVKRVLGEYMVGRPDLSLAFIARATLALKFGGVLASVVPAPFFTAKAAKKIRDLLCGGEFRVRLVGRFRGFQTFDAALVEAAVIVVSRSKTDSPIRVVIAQKGQAEKAVRRLRAIPPTKNVERSGFDIYNVPAESVKREAGFLHRRRDVQFADKLAARTPTRVANLFTVRLGIRGVGARGFQKVLMLSEAQFMRMAPTATEQMFFRPVADHIKHGRIQPSGYVFYPYGTDRQLLLSREDQVVAMVPTFYREVLLPAKQSLIARKSLNRKKNQGASRNWWEPSEPVTTWLASHLPRIVSQEFGRRGNFAFDPNGHHAVVGGHAWCWNGGLPHSNEMFGYIAILNSRVFERLLSVYCPHLQHGFRLEARFVHHIPLPDLTSLTDELGAIGRRIHAGESYDEKLLDAAVLAAYRIGKYGRQDTAKPTQGAGEGQSVGLEKRFRELVKQWKKETVYLSMATRMAAHPAYQEIISMGWQVVPLLLAELRRKPDHWFIALEQITGENPVPPESEGKVKKMAEAWIQWGERGGHLK